MYIEQLEYIVEVMKTGAISKAANHLHVSQAAISQSISQLEAELGIILFKRSRNGTVPTEEGKKIIKKAFEVLLKIRELKEEAEQQNALPAGDLKISAIPSLFTILPKALSSYKGDFPNVNLEISEQGGQEIIEDVRQRKLDIGLVVFSEKIKEENEDLVFEKLLEGKMMICVSKDSHLAYSDELTPRDLLDQSFVMYNAYNWKKFIADLAAKHSKTISLLFTSNNTEVIKKTVAEGLAVSFFSDLSLKNDPFVASEIIVPIPLVDYEAAHITFGWVRSKKQNLSHAAKEFIAKLKSQIATDS